MVGKWLEKQWAVWLRATRDVRSGVFVLTVAVLLFTSPSPAGPMLHLREADSLVARKEYAAALEEYSSLFGAVPAATVHARMGAVFLQKRRWNDAGSHFEQAVAVNPREAEALLGLGILELQRGEIPQAIETLARAQATGSGEIGWRIDHHLGLAYLDNRDFERAKEALSRAIEAARSNQCREAASHFGLGLAYLPTDLTVANSHFAWILETSEYSAAAPPVAADVSVRQGRGGASPNANPHTGEPCVVSALAIPNPSDGTTRDVADLARVMQSVTEELDNTPADEAYAAARLGHALLQIDQGHLARWYLERALGFRPGYVDARAYLGFALWLEGRQEEALQMLSDAVQREPSYAIAHYFLGVVLREQQRLPEAAAEFEAMVRLDPESAEARVELARTLALQARYVEARDVLGKALQMRAESVELKLAAVSFHLDHLFDLERGLEIATEAAKLAPEDAAVQDALGWALYARGRTVEAEEALRRAIAIAPFAAKPRYHLAVLLEKRGDGKGAALEYRRTIDVDVGGYLAERAAAALDALQVD